jgi:hypothetical protein
MAGCLLCACGDLGCWSGHLSTLFFFLVQVPQIVLNQRRRSTAGFSSLSVKIRTLGLSVHICLGLRTAMPAPLLLTSALLYAENVVFLAQFALFNGAPGHLWSALTPAPAALALALLPAARAAAPLVNPATQIICYVPLVAAMLRAGTSHGVSLLGQHLNLCGGLWGFAMCGLLRACAPADWVFYALSVAQALAVFATALAFGEFRVRDRAPAPAPAPEPAPTELLAIDASD